MNRTIPRAQSAMVDRQGSPTREWYSFFQSAFSAAEGDPELQAKIAEILQRLAKLEGSSPLNFKLLGLDSVIITGTPQTGQVQINLEGDTGEPGGTYFYGTGPDGAKGWQLVGDAFVAETGELTKDVEPDTGVITFGLADVPDSGAGTLQAITVDGKGRITGAKAATITGTDEQIVVADGDASAGLPTISLADVPDAGGGALQKTKFDGKGRKTGTSSATTDDLEEGASHLYFTTGRAANAAPVQSVNGKDGNVTLGAADVGAQPESANLTAWSDIAPSSKANASDLAGKYDKTGGPISGDVSVTGAVISRGTSAGLFVYDRVIAGSAYAYYSVSGNFSIFSGALGDNIQTVDPIGNTCPGSGNKYQLGSAPLRWKEVFAENGSINTSDGRYKTSVRPLTVPELAAAVELSGEIGAYQWLAMLAEKGATARQHIGMTVQRAIEILCSHGLDPFAYGFICYDEWPELPEVRGEWPAQPQVVDDYGTLVREAVEAGFEIVQKHRPSGDRYSFRMDELLAFIARGLAHRLEGLEQRLAAAGL